MGGVLYLVEILFYSTICGRGSDTKLTKKTYLMVCLVVFHRRTISVMNAPNKIKK